MIANLRVEPTKDSRHVAADGVWCTVWGHVFVGEKARAVYYARWNDTVLDELEFVVSVGEWGDESKPEERACVAVLGRKHEGRLAFMLVDAKDSSFAGQAVLGSMKAAGEARGSDLAREVFRILDEVLVQDARVEELRARLEA